MQTFNFKPKFDLENPLVHMCEAVDAGKIYTISF